MGNLQTQRFTCKNPYVYPEFYDTFIAIPNMLKMDFVGIQEAYQESICLLWARFKGILPRYCNCKDEAAWSEFRGTFHVHGVPRYAGIDTYPSEVHQIIDRMTEADFLLYSSAVDRFLLEASVTSQIFGVEVLCNSTRRLLHEHTTNST